MPDDKPVEYTWKDQPISAGTGFPRVPDRRDPPLPSVAGYFGQLDYAPLQMEETGPGMLDVAGNIIGSMWEAGPGTIDKLMSGQLQPGTPEAEQAARTTALTFGVPGGAPGEAGVVSSGVKIPRRRAGGSAGPQGLMMPAPEVPPAVQTVTRPPPGAVFREKPRELPVPPKPGSKNYRPPKPSIDPAYDPLTDIERQRYLQLDPIDPEHFATWNPKKQQWERKGEAKKQGLPEVFDYGGRMQEAAITGKAPAGVPQVAVPRAPLPPKGIPPRVTAALSNNDTITALKEAFKAGKAKGGMAWYVTENIHKLYKKLGGTDQDFIRDMMYTGGTSPGSNVPTNIRSQSYSTWLRSPEALGPQPGGGIGPRMPASEEFYAAHDPAQIGSNRPTLPFLPMMKKEGGQNALVYGQVYPYGHPYSQLHQPMLTDIERTGKLATVQHPKAGGGYPGNLLGNWKLLSSDRHWNRKIGLVNTKGEGLDAPDAAWYSTIENSAERLANSLGVPTAPMQSSVWTAGETGVTSGVAPFQAHLESRVQFTSAIYGQDPLTTLQMHIRGQRPLLMGGDLSGMLGSGAAQASQQQDQQ